MKPNRLSKVLAFLLPVVAATTACPGGDDTTPGQDTGTTTANDTSTGPGDTSTSSPPAETGTTEAVDTSEGGSSESGPPAGDACETYCANAMANCSGDNALYPGMAECMATCAGLPEGDPADTAGNTVWCRAYHAGDPAVQDPNMHCPHASASGGDTCGTPCEAYCSLMGANCGGEVAVFPSEADCMAACAAFPVDAPFSATDGNSAQCRVYHASFPAAMDAATHCGHASPNGDNTCGTLCDAYCDQVEQNCGDLYANREACMNTCDGFPTNGEVDAQDGDSVQCRIYHASFPAATDANLHCPHAAEDGGGVCV